MDAENGLVGNGASGSGADGNVPVGSDAAKKQLRARMKEVRSGLGGQGRAAADAAIGAQVVASDAFAHADAVLTYLSVGDEVDTRGIIEAAWDAGKTVAIPRVTGPRTMKWYRITDFGNLERSKLGVEEPFADPLAEYVPGTAARELAIVPGLSFDAGGYRIGYGGGFYDTFLASFGGDTVGLCRMAQMEGDLRALGAVDSHDLPVDAVVTDGGGRR